MTVKAIHNKSIKLGRVIIIALIFFLTAVTVIGLQYTYSYLYGDRIYEGIYVNNIDLSGLTYQEAFILLEDLYLQIPDQTVITLESENTKLSFKASEAGAYYDIEEAVKKAFETGRRDTVIKRVSDIMEFSKNPITIPLIIKYNKEKINSIVERYYNDLYLPVVNPSFYIKDYNLYLYTGKNGLEINKKTLLSLIENTIADMKTTTINVELIIRERPSIDIDMLYKEIYSEPVNSAFEVTDNNIIIHDEAPGRDITFNELNFSVEQSLLLQNRVSVIPLYKVEPSVKKQDIAPMLLRDILRTNVTAFSTATENGKNRFLNIKLAASFINGKILSPGEIFSFNDTVGRRTLQKGYQMAHVYYNGTVIDGVGGGICQVSTTLYNAALYANLEIVERHHHMFTVPYAPFGQDSAVSYGIQDFRFRNSTSWPIKIEAQVIDAGKITFKLIGTKEDNLKVEIINETIKEYPFKTLYKEDPLLPPGTTEVRHEGSKGYIIDTFKIIKKDGSVISSEKLYTSSYKPLTEEIYTGPAEPGNTDDQTEEPIQE